MQSPCDPELRAEIRERMSPPNRESVAEIDRSTGVNAHTLNSWGHRWKQEGLLVPATSKAPEEWSAADKLAAVIQAAGLSGADLGAYCRERGLHPKQLARWRQVAEDANTHKVLKNKVPIVAAISLNAAGHPIYAKISPVTGLSSEAIAGWAQQH